MASIFLSYATVNRKIVDAIRHELEGRQYSTWMDHCEIRGGQEWEQEIATNLARCDVFLVSITEASNKSKWVQRETILAEQLQKKRIPLLLESEIPFRLLDVQFIDFRTSFEEGISKLLDVLETFLLPTDAPQRPPSSIQVDANETATESSLSFSFGATITNFIVGRWLKQKKTAKVHKVKMSTKVKTQIKAKATHHRAKPAHTQKTKIIPRKVTPDRLPSNQVQSLLLLEDEDNDEGDAKSVSDEETSQRIPLLDKNEGVAPMETTSAIATNHMNDDDEIGQTRRMIHGLLFCVPHGWMEDSTPTNEQLERDKSFLCKARLELSTSVQNGQGASQYAESVNNFLDSLLDHLDSTGRQCRSRIKVGATGNIVLRLRVNNHKEIGLDVTPNSQTHKLLLEGIDNLFLSLLSKHSGRVFLGGTWPGSICVLLRAPDSVMDLIVKRWKELENGDDASANSDFTLLGISSVFSATAGEEEGETTPMPALGSNNKSFPLSRKTIQGHHGTVPVTSGKAPSIGAKPILESMVAQLESKERMHPTKPATATKKTIQDKPKPNFGFGKVMPPNPKKDMDNDMEEVTRRVGGRRAPAMLAPAMGAMPIMPFSISPAPMNMPGFGTSFNTAPTKANLLVAPVAAKGKFSWILQSAPTLPEFHHLERTSTFVPNTTAALVSSRISGVLRDRSIEATYDDSKARAKCVTLDGVDFRVRLYRGRNQYGHGIIVEVQRRFGSSFQFHADMTAILDAAQGKTPLPPPLVSNLIPEAYDDDDDFAPTPTGAPCLVMIAKLLQMSGFDAQHLGLQMLAPLVDSDRLSIVTARVVSMEILKAENEVGRKILDYIMNKRSDESAIALRVMSLQIFANAIKATKSVVPQSVRPALRAALLEDLVEVEEYPRKALMATKCLEYFVCDDPKVAELNDAFENARDVGHSRYVALVKQAERCMTIIEKQPPALRKRSTEPVSSKKETATLGAKHSRSLVAQEQLALGEAKSSTHSNLLKRLCSSLDDVLHGFLSAIDADDTFHDTAADVEFMTCKLDDEDEFSFLMPGNRHSWESFFSHTSESWLSAETILTQSKSQVDDSTSVLSLSQSSEKAATHPNKDTRRRYRAPLRDEAQSRGAVATGSRQRRRSRTPPNVAPVSVQPINSATTTSTAHPRLSVFNIRNTRKLSMGSSVLLFSILILVSFHGSQDSIGYVRSSSGTIDYTGSASRFSENKYSRTATPISAQTDGKLGFYCPRKLSNASVFVPFQDSARKLSMTYPLLQTRSGIQELLAKGTFPRTHFTPHVQAIVNLMETNDEKIDDTCKWKFYFTVPEPFTAPTKLHCMGKARERIVPWWCKIFEQMFGMEGRSIPVGTNSGTGSLAWPLPVLPTNVTVAISSNDKDDYYASSADSLACLASSSPNGTFAITNFLELQRMADRTEYAMRPWEERCPIPTWRGSAWMRNGGGRLPNDPNDDSLVHAVASKSPRLQAVLFSKQYPDLLDARISDARNGFLNTQFNKQQARLWANNSTNGLHQFLPLHEIPTREYYTNYQIAVVLCGLGASFRTSIHLSTATAVVLQSCPETEWFVPYMIPWVHYIPLDKDLVDLQHQMEWIQGHPQRVYEIAQAGHDFYQAYLSFERNYEHFYELLYRMALKKQELTT